MKSLNKLRILFVCVYLFLVLTVGFADTSSNANDIKTININNATSHNELKSVLQYINSLTIPVLLPMQGANSDVEIKSTEQYIPRYEEGQGGVGLGFGVVFPLAFQRFTGEFTNTNLTVGGSIWFDWDIFLWKGLSVGMEIAGMFALTPNSRALFMAPITAHAKYTFQVFPIEFPVSFALGVNMGSLEENFKADFIMKPKTGITYRINQNWSTGLFISYWFIVQSYETTLGSKYSRLGHFIDLTAGVTYVF